MGMTTFQNNVVHSKYAGKQVKIRAFVKEFGGQMFQVSDFWNTLTGMSWILTSGNPACTAYARRTADIAVEDGYFVPLDDNVYYGHLNGLGYLFHARELEVENERPNTSFTQN